MRYRIDHDYHIHSNLSTCSRDPEQTTQRILRYAKDNGLRRIVLSDHFWDERIPCTSKWYAPQNYDHIRQVLPLPQEEGIEFLFGAETELNAELTLGVSDERWDMFDFINIPTTHMHFRFVIDQQSDAKARADAWVCRLDSLLSRDLPFHKIGFAHLVCPLIAPDTAMYRAVLSMLPEQKLEELFAGCAKAGVGIELNHGDLQPDDDTEKELILKPFRIAKQMGCKFYLGSDVHQQHKFEGVAEVFDNAVTWLDLHEEDKFFIGK